MASVQELLKKKPKVINMGLESFYESLKDQNQPVVHIKWKPPAGGKRHLLEIIRRLR